jgi:hypothetical protein
MSSQKVLLLGATGETGGDILDGLIEDGSFVSYSSDIFHVHFLSKPVSCLINR